MCKHMRNTYFITYGTILVHVISQLASEIFSFIHCFSHFAYFIPHKKKQITHLFHNSFSYSNIQSERSILHIHGIRCDVQCPISDSDMCTKYICTYYIINNIWYAMCWSANIPGQWILPALYHIVFNTHTQSWVLFYYYFLLNLYLKAEINSLILF